MGGTLARPGRLGSRARALVRLGTVTTPTGKSPLQRTVTETPTSFWNDSCAIAELQYAIAHGAVGATSNPSIVGEVLKKEWDTWAPRVKALGKEHPDWSDVDVTWAVIHEMAVKGAKLLEPIFEKAQGRSGRLSIQTNPTFHGSAEKMLAQAKHFQTLAPNMQVKFPTTRAGVKAMEEATFEGIAINATVSFTLPQALAVAEAVEQGLKRREAKGLDVSKLNPVCTLMIGRMDDWVKQVCERDDLTIDPAAANWAGLAVFKRAHALYRERGYRTKLLAAAYRHHLHWSELIGGDVVLTMPAVWQRRFNASSVEVKPRFADPVPAKFVEELVAKVPDFVKAYEPNGLTAAEFDTYGATVRTLRTFISAYWDLVKTVDDLLLPNPDVKPKA
ncbi:MAG: transaldolase family protein [Myxococcaceae bacterium]|nr:transaldolase family protein [Myxococcaceae bacterium]